MAYGTTGVGDVALVSMLVRRLGRLVGLKRTLEDAGPRAQHRVNLVHAAMRSTLVDLARLDKADLGAAVLAGSRRNRLPRSRARKTRRAALDQVLDEPARR